MKKGTISLIGILCMLAGGLFFFSNEPTALYLGVGMIVIGILIIVAALLGLFKSFVPHQHQVPEQQQFSYTPTPVQQSVQQNIAGPPKRESPRDAERKEQRRKELDAEADTLKTIIQNEVWGIEDVRRNASIRLDSAEVQYIAQQLPTPFFAVTVWELHQKITEQRLADNEMFKILDDGSESLQEFFMETYTNSTSWTMSSSLLERLINKNPLMIFGFGNIRKETVSTTIDRVPAYELLGYRMKPLDSGENFESSFVDFKKSTPENEVKISYYDSTDTNIIHYLEEHHPNETALRQKAFTKILAGSANVISMITGVDDLSEDEIRQIFERNYKEEISALFEKLEASDVVAIFPPLYAVKVALQLVECDYEDQVNENYDFENIPVTTYQQIIAELSAEELLGYDDRGDGNHDIIKLFEDHSVNDEPLRKTAFDKMRTSKHFCDAIARWEDVSEDEVKIIMDNKDELQINALFGREDSEDIITNLPEEVAIKIRLELIYPDACETVKDNYQFDDENAFKKIIADLSAKELLGFRVNPNDSESFSNDADYDMIKFIEDDMGDNDTLRDLAFAKMCQSDNMSEAIARWENVAESEVAKIMDRGIDAEINALLGREDSEDVITNLPEEVAIKIRLELIYPDASDGVKESYQFDDENAFKKIIADLSAKELLGFRVNPNDSESFSNDADYDMIKFIEDEMSDNDTLRTLAFAKMCESDDMSEAIARWENITESEVASIVERGKSKEMTALLERDDVESIITDMPDNYIIGQYLLDDGNDTIKDEFNSRIDDQKFIDKIKKMAKGISVKNLTNNEKEGSVEDLSDEKLIKIKLSLIEIDDCSFDFDDIENEFSDRMGNNAEFEQKVKNLVAQLA
ncbi:MAG: hypothetical protein NT085_00130 [candidate division SR1 bacterium]|nr:hypothetical protein [candidate division SR1 bacterium]